MTEMTILYVQLLPQVSSINLKLFADVINILQMCMCLLEKKTNESTAFS